MCATLLVVVIRGKKIQECLLPRAICYIIWILGGVLDLLIAASIIEVSFNF